MFQPLFLKFGFDRLAKAVEVFRFLGKCSAGGIEIFCAINGFGILRSMGKTVFLGLRPFALGQSSFLAIVQPLIAIDRH